MVGSALTILIPGAPWGSHPCTVARISSGLGWTREGTGRFLPLWFGAGPSLQCQIRHVLIALCRAVFTPNLDLLGINTGSLVALITEHTAGGAVPLFLCGGDNESAKWASDGRSANKWDVTQGRHWKRWSPSLMCWTVWGGQGLWALWLRCIGSCWDNLSLSYSGGQHFINVVKGSGRRNAPGQQLDWVSCTCLRENFLVGSVCLFSHLANHFPCFLANLICWSSYFLVNPSTSWANSHLSWTLALMMPCNHFRAWWKPGPSSVWEPSSQWGWGWRGNW